MAGATDKDAHPEYWREYSNLQRTKHELIKCYLNGWLPKLGSWAGRILYLDTHAGRGRHESGDYGSPLVALRTVLEHKYRNAVFGDCEIVFFFVERDQENASALEQEIVGLGGLPNQVQTIVVVDDCYKALSSLLDDLKKSRGKLAPAFVFVDPYGFKVPGNLLRELMGFERVELFINVIWRELSMAIAQGDMSPGLAETLKTVFDGNDWRELIGLEFESQAGACVDLLRSKIGARWATHIRMLGNNNATRYMLMHLTNHDAGRDQMKDCMWKVSPVHPFIARASDDPNQEFLIEPEPDLAPLRQWVLKRLSRHPWRWQELSEEIRGEVWRVAQLNDVIRQLRRENLISYRGANRFVPKQNPELYLINQE
jgi:three-Cys-motif partner protein